MLFPAYVHSVVGDSDHEHWPVQGQGVNECGCTVAANGLNLLMGRRLYDKDRFVREAGIFFNRRLGGSLSPVTGWLISRHGYGTHFGNLRYTDAEIVLRDLIDRKVPVSIEIGSNRVGPLVIYGQHSMLLVGYSDPYRDGAGALREEYYFVDSQWPALGQFDLQSNDRVENGVQIAFPGNRTIARTDFIRMYETRIYFPIFRTPAEHGSWYRAHIQPRGGVPVLSWVNGALLSGSDDLWQDLRARG